MKAIPPRVLECPVCDTVFVADPSFYTACNCGPPLACLHGDVDVAVYETTCPAKDCGTKVSAHEHVREIPKERR